LFYGGYEQGCCGSGTRFNTVTRINNCGALVGTQGAVGTARRKPGGAKVGVNGLFYAGNISGFDNCTTASATLTRINACGTIVGSETNNVGTARAQLVGAPVGNNGLYYSGKTRNVYSSGLNTVTRINACGALVGSQTSAGTAGHCRAGANVGAVGVFYAGADTSVITNRVTRINACGTLVGSETTVGSAVIAIAGAGI
jgi:hypothetical protein